jgi:hypothetical protein
MNTVMNLRVSYKMLGSSWVAAQLAAFQDGLNCMALLVYSLFQFRKFSESKEARDLACPHSFPYASTHAVPRD